MTTSNAPHAGRPFRFFDNREKYLLFVTTCNEKLVIAKRVAMDITHLHNRFPTVPFLVVGKEISPEDGRISLEKMADRFHEHPQTVLVLTNMFYSEATRQFPRSEEAQSRLNWLEVQLEGDSAFEFDEQINKLEPEIRDWWQTYEQVDRR